MNTKFTVLTEANRRLAQCLMYDGKDRPAIPLLKGGFWDVGYFHDGIDVKTAVAKRPFWSANVTHAHTYANALRDFVWDSSMSSPYYPFLLQLEAGQNEADRIKHALGLNVGKAFIEVVGDMIIENRHHTRSLFWDAEVDREVEEYFSEQEIEIYLHVTAQMKQNLQELQMIRFPDGYTRYPVFFVGHTHAGDLVGVAAFQLDR